MQERGAESYWEKAEWTGTWSRITLKPVYTPKDVEGLDYERHLNDPGEYPYTRGVYKDMYRGRLWTRREVSGHSSPSESNKRLRFLLSQGETGLNIIPDVPTQNYVDSDHPFALASVGVQGTPLCSLRDMEILLEDIPQEKVSFTFSSHFMPMVQYIGLARKRGVDFTKLRGTIISDPLHSHFCGFTTLPLDLALKLAIDAAEFAIKHMPYWYPLCVDAYDLRETGITAAQEVAFAFSLAFTYIDKLLERGLGIDEIAPKISFTFSAHIDLFEEVAKLRAARRLWAEMVAERYRAKNPHSLKLKFHCNTAGSAQVRQQPLNNIVRIAYQAMAAVLGGAQSLHCVCYDEPISLPTELSHRIALRTQEILAYEVGVARVADPLGGSFFVEWLTNKLEEEIRAIIAEIDRLGGGYEAVRSGWMDQEMKKMAVKYQEEVEKGERIIVGRNAYQEGGGEEEEGFPIHRIDPARVEEHLESLRRLREERDKEALKRAIHNLRECAEKKEVNLIPAILEACEAYATLGEITGVIREAYGYPYDYFEVLENPFR